MIRIASAVTLLLGLLLAGPADARDIYVSRTTGDNGNPGTKEAPKKLLWKVMNDLQEGDTVRVAAGVYNGRKKSGTMPKITVGKVTIEGGWTTDFSARDPFKHLTIITGTPDRQADTAPVFEFGTFNNKGCPIVLDGFCIDRGPGLYYTGHGEGGTDRQEGYFDTSCWGYQAINKKKSGSSPTIQLLGRGSFTVRNMLLINNPWWGIYVKAGGEGEVIVENNLVLSYQGRGIEVIAGGGWGKPKFIIRNNTVAFGATMEGRALSIDPRPSYSGSYLVENNVLAFGTQSGFMTKFGMETLQLQNNLFYGFTEGDAGDGGSPMCNADEFEDELDCDNAGNAHAVPGFVAKVPQAYFDRWSQWDALLSPFFSDEEMMAARKANGLGEYVLPFYPGKTYATYAKLPKERVNFGMSRYPKPFKKGEELMSWPESVLPLIGSDGARGVQAFSSK